MTETQITELATILYNKVMEWVKVTPEEDRQDIELIEAIDELDLPENLQTIEGYDAEDVLRACFYSSTYDNEEPPTIGVIEGYIEQGIENLEDGTAVPLCGAEIIEE